MLNKKIVAAAVTGALTQEAIAVVDQDEGVIDIRNDVCFCIHNCMTNCLASSPNLLRGSALIRAPTQ